MDDVKLRDVGGTESKPHSGRTSGITGIIAKYKYLYLMFIPVLIWYVIFHYIPMYGVVTAFQDYNMNKGNFGSPFVGLKHFETLLHDVDFWSAFNNTIIIAFYRFIIEFPIPVVIAVMLNEIKHLKYKKAIQTIIYLPHFLSWVIVASLLLTIFSPEKGLVAATAMSFGAEVPDVLMDPGAFRSILIWSDVWKEAGWSTIIYVAAMAAIDPYLYEAAVVDGCGRWNQIWHITLPGIRNVIVIMLILMAGTVLNWGFDQVYNLYNPMVYETGDIIDTYIFRTALGDNKLSYAAAAGLLKSVICVILLLTTNRVAGLFDEEGIY